MKKFLFLSLSIFYILGAILLVGCDSNTNNSINNNNQVNSNQEEIVYDNNISNFEFKLNESKDGYIMTVYIGDSLYVDIPSEYNGKPVKEVGEYSFCNSNIISVKIPDTIEVIGNDAFYYCSQLKNVQMSKNIKVIGRSSFRECIKLQSIDLGYAEEVGTNAFLNCLALKITYINNLDLYKQIEFSYSTGDITTYSKTIRIPKTVVDSYYNEYMENTNNFTRTEDGDFYIFSRVD